MEKSTRIKVGRLVTTLSGIALCGFGGAFLVAPEKLAAQTAIVLMLPGAVADIRATYGGFELGMGLFFLLCAARSIWLTPALAAQVFAFGGFALGRATGIVVDAAFDPATLLLFGLEISGFALAAFALQLQVDEEPEKA